MRWQVAAATAVLVVAGAGAGWAAQRATDVPAASSGAAEPVPAESPRLPFLTEDELTADQPQPPLAAGVPLVETSFGISPTRLVFEVPRAWKRLTNAPNEFRWKVPGHPQDTYVLRVTHVGSQKRTIAEHRAERIRSAKAGENGVDVLDESGDGLTYTYVDDLGHRRHLVVRWLDLAGSPLAEAEVNLSGRVRDADGAADLVRRVAASLRQE